MLRFQVARRVARRLLQEWASGRGAGVVVGRKGNQEIVTVSAARGGAEAMRALARPRSRSSYGRR